MAYTATTGNDMIYLGNVFNSMSQPGGGTFTVDGLAGSDTLCLWGDSTGAYDTNKGFNFTITSNTYDAATTLWTISGASAGRSLYTFKLTNIEFFKLHSASTPVAPTVTPPVNDNVAPVLLSATIASGFSSLLLTYDDANNLASDATHIPSAAEFSVKINAAPPVTPTGVAVSGKIVTLTLPSVISATDTVLLNYTKAALGTNAIQDASSNYNLAVNLINQSVTVLNDTTPPTIPDYTAATPLPIGSDIVINFDDVIHLNPAITGLPIAIRSGSATGTAVESYAATDTTHLSISASGKTLTINPTADLAYNTHYYVTFESVTTSTSHERTTTTYGVSPIVNAALLTMNNPTTTPTGTHVTYDFTTIADPFVAHTGTVVDSGPVLVGAGGAGILAWMFFI